jgi:hypothetical protein
MDGQGPARVQRPGVEHRRINRMIWRKHSVCPVRFAMSRRFTADRFWLPMANSIGQCKGYGTGTRQGSSLPDSRT